MHGRINLFGLNDAVLKHPSYFILITFCLKQTKDQKTYPFLFWLFSGDYELSLETC